MATSLDTVILLVVLLISYMSFVILPHDKPFRFGLLSHIEQVENCETAKNSDLPRTTRPTAKRQDSSMTSSR